MSLNPHPELPEFEYIRPASYAETSQFLAQHPGEARVLSGGTDVFVRMRDGFWNDKYLLDVKHLDGAKTLAFDPVCGLIIGAGVVMNQVAAAPAVLAHYPLLAEAAQSVASYQLRNRATVIGNICNASPAGDTIGACLVYQGVLKVHGVNGPREIPLSGFFTGPGKTELQPGDVVTAIALPVPPTGAVGTYLKLGRNKLSDLSIVGVAALAYPDSSARSGYRFRLALASVAPVPFVPTAAEQFLSETIPSAETFAEAARLTMEACAPIDDVRSSARYRKEMVKNMTRKALNALWTHLGQ
ncbi:MAG TPA: xanthine dehydrogenase family protein subunit M [Anaerolineaceae bacterium]|nr:xanthine dehydrogenase family protein subunit M [Anaerolineaceae bacterium]